MQGEALSPKAQAQFDHAMMLVEHLNMPPATKGQMNALAMAMLKQKNLQGQGTLAGAAAPVDNTFKKYPILISSSQQQLKEFMNHKGLKNDISGWQYDHEYKGKKPRVELIYVNAAGSRSQTLDYFTRSWGHVAVSVDGIVYSYDPSGLHVVKRSDYIMNTTHAKEASQVVYSLPIEMTSHEVDQLHETFQHIRKNPKPYTFNFHNCAHVAVGALVNATQGSELPIIESNYPNRALSSFILTPRDVIDSVKDAKRLFGVRIIYVPPQSLRVKDYDRFGYH